MPVAGAAEYLGKAVGSLAVEIALGKGIGAGLTALRGLPAATAFLKTANELKQTIGKLPVPTPGMKVVVDTMGNKMVFPDVELTKLEDIIKPMESRASKILSGGVEKAKAINLPAWNKLTVDVEHILERHKIGGKILKQSTAAGGAKDVFPEWMTDKQILSAVKEAYGNAKKVETQVRESGEKVAVLIGKSGNLEIKMYINLTTKILETAFPQY